MPTRRMRITRIPLNPNEREERRTAGTLPDDYLDRQLEVDDYVDVDAPDDADDAQLRALALDHTRLTFKGERAFVQEVMPDASKRALNGVLPEGT